MKNIFLVFCIALYCSACAGPSKARYKILLGECRDQNRERARVIKEFQSRTTDAPEQSYSIITYGETGY